MTVFNLQEYEKLLSVAIENDFRFQDFHSYSTQPTDRILLLRHDVDADLEAAYKMALLENIMGVRSTYFIMLRSPVYNLFSRQNATFVEQIINLGHTIGLHYDEGYYPNGKDFSNLLELINTESNTLNNFFQITIKSVSFHQPSQTIVKNSIELDGLKNTYSEEFFKYFFYISDSNMSWKNHSPEYYFRETAISKIQLLIHPMWWVNGTDFSNSTENIWTTTLIKQFKQMEKQLLETERAYGRARNINIVGK